MSILTEEQVKAIIDQSQAELQSAIVEQAKNDIAVSFKWTLTQELQKLVDSYIKEEIAPELSAILVTSKEGILASCTLSMEKIAVQLSETIVAQATENLATSYKRSAILKALFE
jgi:hypothetical protein